MKTKHPATVFPTARPKGFCRSFCLIAAIATSLVTAAHSQPITPVWEYLINNLPSPLPILTNATPYTTDIENGDGLSLMDCIGPMRRYDANRLLIGIRENGIDESGASGAYNTNLATSYPDRSLIWINPTNGQPMGLALTMGLTPVPVTPEVVAAGGTPGQYYWNFDVSEDGYIYTGYKNQMLRYAPNGSGGFLPAPTVVFTISGDLGTNTLAMSVGQWSGYFWETVRVRGSGANTKILAGTGGGRGIMLLTTTDGNSFAVGAYRKGGFGTAADNASSFIPSKDPSTPDDIWFYGGSFPFNSSGVDTRFYRAKASPPFDVSTPFLHDGLFVAATDPNTNNLNRYLGLFSASCDAHPDLDFVVHYSAPPYNQGVAGDKPGWLAIHDATNGNFIASYQLSVSGASEWLTADNSPLWMGNHGSVSLNPLADGTAEVLWTSEIYGYGRYIVGTPRYTKAAAMSKNIKLLWEQLQGQPNILPIIDTDVNSDPVPGNGFSTMHCFTGFKKYDATRMLLAIRDNGINETVAHNTNLALAYPDRSLQWINAETGNPMGTALVVSFAPPISDDNKLYMAFGVSEDGVLYVGVADKIMRYAPSGGGFAAPTVAFTLPADPQPSKTQFAEFRVSGSGASTVIVVAHRNWWGSSDSILTTADGLTYTETETVPTSGGISSVVPDPTTPGDNVLFKTLYPASSNGIDSTMQRRRQASGTGPFFGDSFPVEQVAGSSIVNSVDVIYRTYFLTDVQALSGQDWVMAYSTPSFRTFNNPTVQSALKGSSPDPMPYQPGWLAIHDQATGEVRGLRKLNVTEALNVIPSTTGAPESFTTGWFSYAIPQGGVELYPVLNAASEVAGVEILWWSATYGFGRYYVDTAPAANHLRGTKVTNGFKLEWNGAGVLQSSSSVTGPYADVIGVSSGYIDTGTATKFFRLRLQ